MFHKYATSGFSPDAQFASVLHHLQFLDTRASWRGNVEILSISKLPLCRQLAHLHLSLGEYLCYFYIAFNKSVASLC